MKKFSGLLSKRASQAVDPAARDSPEGTVTVAVKLFCESGAASANGEEVLHLPVIVEACESSPGASAAAAKQIRRYLKNGFMRPSVQYNSIMLIRILTDNPGPSFTKNMDSKFVDAMKGLLNKATDPSVQQIAQETLTALERDKSGDENLAPLLAMWKTYRESTQTNRRGYPQFPQAQGQQPMMAYPNNYAGQDHRSRSSGRRHHRDPNQLPEPHELAGRIEESRTSAKLLIQLVQSTPIGEFQTNDLIAEFAERCQSAQRSMQTYMNADPQPDENTLQTLIEACEQISLAQSRYQRALLAARREVGTPPVHMNDAAAAALQPGFQPTSAMADRTSYGAPGAPQSALSAQQSSFPASTSIFASRQGAAAAPPARQANLTTAAGAEPKRLSNPFADENGVPDAVAGVPVLQPTVAAGAATPPSIAATPKEAGYNYGRAPHPAPGAFELPGESYNTMARLPDGAANATATAVAPRTPPRQQHQQQHQQQQHLYDDDDEDLYGVSPVVSKTAAVAMPEEQYRHQPSLPSSPSASVKPPPTAPPSRKPLNTSPTTTTASDAGAVADIGRGVQGMSVASPVDGTGSAGGAGGQPQRVNIRDDEPLRFD